MVNHWPPFGRGIRRSDRLRGLRHHSKAERGSRNMEPVEGDRPWIAPTGNVLVERKWKYAAPPWVIYEAIVNDLRRWLHPSGGERTPAVTAGRRPDAVLLQPWVDPVVNAVEVLIDNDGPGSVVKCIANGDSSALPDDQRRTVRHRLGQIFGSSLRDWVDEGHM